MISQNQPKVAVLGMSEAGRGWATLVSAAGWQVTIYDPDAAQLHGGEEEIATRKRHSHGTGVPAITEDNHNHPPGEPRLGRSLLDAVTTADGSSTPPKGTWFTGNAFWNRSKVWREWRPL